LKPGGMVMLSAGGDLVLSSAVNCFAIGEGYRLHLRPQPHLNLPCHSRQNRDMLAIFSPFSNVKSFTYRNGIREFLFHRDTY